MVSYAHKICYTSFAPASENQANFRPPAPQEWQLMQGKLHKHAGALPEGQQRAVCPLPPLASPPIYTRARAHTHTHGISIYLSLSLSLTHTHTHTRTHTHAHAQQPPSRAESNWAEWIESRRRGWQPRTRVAPFPSPPLPSLLNSSPSTQFPLLCLKGGLRELQYSAYARLPGLS